MGIELLIFAIDNTLVQEGAVLTEAALCYISSVVAKVKNINQDKITESIKKHAENLWKSSPYYPYFQAQGIEALDGLFLFFENSLPGLEDLQEWSTYYRVEAWSKALFELGIDEPDYAEEVAVEFLTTTDSRYRLFPDTQKVLQELLKRGFRLAVITNGEESLQMEKLIALNLEKYFEKIIIGENIGLRKPDKRVFNFLLEQMDVFPENALMIGNSLIDDIQGAKKAGMKSVLISTNKMKQSTEIKPDYEISSLIELIPLAVSLR